MNYFVHQIFYLKSIQHPRLYCFIKRATSPIEYKPEGKALTSRRCVPCALPLNTCCPAMLKILRGSPRKTTAG